MKIKKEFKDESGVSFSLEYDISEKKMVCDGSSYTAYGISVTLFGGSVAQTKCIQDITSDKSKIEKIEKNLSDGYVTPITLQDVVEDLIS